MSDPDVMARLAAIESELTEIRAMQDLLLRLMSIDRPLSSLLQSYGATESKERALYRLLDELAEAARGPKHLHPTFGLFKVRLGEMFPEHRGDRQFVQLVIDTLRIERPVYRELHAYMTAHKWPVWD